MTEKGLVTKIKRNTVYVKIKQTAKCENCKACVFGKDKTVIIPAITKLSLEVGDEVTVQMPQKSITVAPLILYAIPLLAMIMGAIIGTLLSNVMQIVCAFLFLFVSLTIALILDRFYFRRKQKYNPIVVERLKETASNSVIANQQNT